jgi:hypothetical protein
MARIPGGAVMLILDPSISVPYLGNRIVVFSLNFTGQRDWESTAGSVKQVRYLGNILQLCSLSILGGSGGRHA